ncbi:hypothetical protein [Actinosynnema sp. NPDC020468]|uniref:RNA polymerase sigma factor n=1 Tax=Actinosynnema sp. NPDC020468 TaxID=3154488 RepID=UPI0034056571
MDDTVGHRQADAELRDALIAEDCAGPVWDRFKDALAEYGFALVMAWLKSEAIFALCTEKGCPPGDPPPYWDRDDLESLAADTVVKAMEVFRRKALLEGGWDPRAGASLTTYFATGCVYAFPNIYRKWRKEFLHRLDAANRSARAEVLADLPSTARDPGDVVVTRLQIRNALAGIEDERAVLAVRLQGAGYTVGEIAEALGTSHGAIKGALERLRRTVNRSTGNGTEDV